MSTKQRSDYDYESDNRHALWSTGHCLDEDSGVHVPFVCGDNKGAEPVVPVAQDTTPKPDEHLEHCRKFYGGDNHV